jgi:hypothetical protein
MKLLLMMVLLCFGIFSFTKKAPAGASMPEKEAKASFELTPSILIFAY